jgi:hypothetical protein
MNTNLIKMLAQSISVIAIANPAIIGGAIITVATNSLTYKYAPSFICAATAIRGLSFVNTKLAKVAIEQNNPEAYDYFATIYEFLEKMPGGFFPKLMQIKH